MRHDWQQSLDLSQIKIKRPAAGQGCWAQFDTTISPTGHRRELKSNESSVRSCADLCESRPLALTLCQRLDGRVPRRHSGRALLRRESRNPATQIVLVLRPTAWAVAGPCL